MVEQHFGDKIEPLEVAMFEHFCEILMIFEIIWHFEIFQKIKNHHFFAKKFFYKKCKIIMIVADFIKILRLGTLSMCFCTLQASEHIFSPQRGVILNKTPSLTKFSCKMAFLRGKNAFFDFESKNTPQDASKCVFELGNR